MKKFFCRFVINLTQSYPHANANVIKEGGAVLYRKLVLVFAAAALTLPFMAGPAYSLTGSFVLPGHGSFSYDCQTSSPVGASYTFDTGANTFNAHVGALTCVFTLDDQNPGSIVQVPFVFDLTYNNVAVQTDGSTTTVTATCPTATYAGSFQKDPNGGECQVLSGSSTACDYWKNQLPGEAFVFQTPWVGAPKGQISGICADNFPAVTGGLGLDVEANWSVSSVPGETDATDPQFRFCATPSGEPCTETVGTGKSKTLYVRGASGSGVITLIGDAQAVNTWNVSNPQQGNYNVQYNPTPELDPHNLTDIRVEGVLNTGCSDFGTYIQCKFPATQLSPILQPRVVNGKVSVTGTAETTGGTPVIFFFTANTN